MNELRQLTLKVFGKGITGDEQKYYYFDSDDDRIEVSDDEDLESAIVTCKQPCLKIYVENYDSKKDPFFRNSNNSSNKADQKTGASSDRSKTAESKMSKLIQSTKSADDSIESDDEPEDELPMPVDIKETVSCDSSFSEEEKENEVGEVFTTPLTEQKVSQRKNTEFEQNTFDLLDEKECKVSSRSIPRG